MCDVKLRAHHLAAALATSALFAVAVLAHAQDKMDEMEGGMQMQQIVRHDPAFFRTDVLPLLERECIGCHDADDPDNITRHRLTAPDDGTSWTPESVEANYKGITALLHAPAPERSTLLSKLAPMTRGGVDHDGGKADGTDFDTALLDPQGPLVSWIFGASATEKPPVAVLAPWPRTLDVGTELNLDATLSFDPDGDKPAVTWEILEKPLGAEAKLEAKSGAKTKVTPDRAGPWVIRCNVKAEKLGAWPVYVRVDATRVRETGTAGDGPTTEPLAKVASVERRLTRRLYFDLYGRSPIEEELAQVAALPFEDRVDKLLGAAETWEHWFKEESFYFLLIDRFRPVSDRLAAIPGRMREGRASFRDAHMEFALSAEFNSRNPGNDTYVTVILEQFLGIEVQKDVRLLEAAKKMYDGEKTRIFKTLGTNQANVVQISLAQPAYLEVFANRMAMRYRGAPLTEEEHYVAVERMKLDPMEFPKILREWLTSEEYQQEERPPVIKDDHQFIRGLFVDLLGRPPALQEFRNMRNALQALTDPAPVRGVLAKVMLDSGAVLPPAGLDGPAPEDEDPTGGSRTSDGSAKATSISADTITSLFNRLLGRDPSADELKAFVEVLSEPGATWRTAALALLSSSQYQYY